MTEAEFSRQLSELSNVAADLNRESDSINDTLSQYESKIRALNVGIDVSVGIGCGTLTWMKLAVYEKSPDGKGQRHTGKHQWGLAIERDCVLEASREQRIAALKHIPNLVAKLTAEAQARLDAILQAKELLQK